MHRQVAPAEAGRRLDLWLAAERPEWSRSQIRRWIDEGLVTVNGRVVKAGLALRPGDSVRWSEPEDAPREGEPPAEDLPVDVLYQDEDLAVINKPAGMVVHPAAGVWTGTLVGALKGRGITLARLGGPLRPGIVHRLDKGTTGLLVVARADAAYAALVRAMAGRRVSRHYRALVWGDLAESDGAIEAPIGRSRADRQRMTVVRQGGRPALTRWTVRERFGLVTDLDLKLETGRTHQIRVHWRHRGHPVFGDPGYGGRSRGGELAAADRQRIREWLALIDRQALHAARLEFDHPRSGQRMVFEAPLPDDMARLYDAVRAGGQYSGV